MFPDLGMAGLGVVRAISFPKELGLNSFILEGDSTTVINSLNSAENSLSPFGHILSSAKPTLVIIIVFLFLMYADLVTNLTKYVRRVRALLIEMLITTNFFE